MERLGNLANFYRAQGEDAIAAYNRGDFEECDSACFELLQKSDLPPIWRAECNYLLGTSTSSTAVVYAAEAVRRYQILSARDPESSYLREALGEAQLSLTAAQQESTLPTGNEIDESQDDLDEAEDCDGRSQETDDDESEDEENMTVIAPPGQSTAITSSNKDSEERALETSMIESPFPQRSRKRARSVSSPASETAQPADEEHPGTRQSVAPSDSQPSASTVPAAIPSSSQTAIQSFQEVEEPLSKLLKEEHDDGNETEIIDDVEAASDGAVDRAGSS